MSPSNQYCKRDRQCVTQHTVTHAFYFILFNQMKNENITSITNSLVCQLFASLCRCGCFRAKLIERYVRVDYLRNNTDNPNEHVTNSDL